jgi:hypothetical protein
MQVLLRVNLDEPLTVDDAAVQQPLPEPLATQLRAQPYLGGSVEINEPGHEALVIPDDLEQLVPRLCVLSLSTLEAGKPLTVPLFTDSARITLSPQGDRLEIALPGDRKESYALGAALAALEACGARYARLIELNFPHDTSRQMKLAAVQVELLQRREAREDAEDLEPPPLLRDDEIPGA